MSARFVVDGQRQPREPIKQIELLDSAGVDRRMTPPPLVFEHSSFDEFIACGGWVKTVPAELGDMA